MPDTGSPTPQSPHSPRILVFGGTFDPPHLAHARLPALAAAQLGCDEILYVPAAVNPLKFKTPPTASEHRLAMLWLTIADVPNARISTIELNRPGPSYTIDTLRELKGNREVTGTGSVELHLLIGSDQALHFHEWKDWQQMLLLATPAVMIRPPLDDQAFAIELHRTYSPVEAEQWLKWTLRLPQMEISATDLRHRLAKGESVNNMLDPATAEYIRANGLYQLPTEPVGPGSD